MLITKFQISNVQTISLLQFFRYLLFYMKLDTSSIIISLFLVLQTIHYRPMTLFKKNIYNNLEIRLSQLVQTTWTCKFTLRHWTGWHTFTLFLQDLQVLKSQQKWWILHQIYNYPLAIMAAKGDDGYSTMQELITITSIVSAYYDSIWHLGNWALPIFKSVIHNKMKKKINILPKMAGPSQTGWPA